MGLLLFYEDPLELGNVLCSLLEFLAELIKLKGVALGIDLDGDLMQSVELDVVFQLIL